MRRILFLPLLLLPGAAAAQTSLLELQPGVRVRVTAPPALGSRYEATIGARRGDTLSLVREGFAPISIAISDLSHAELYHGKSRIAGMWRGAKWGTGIGLGAGALLALSDSVSSYCDRDSCFSDAEMVGFLTFTGAFYGGAIGALIGLNQWEPLVLPSERFSLTLNRRRSRAQLGVRMAF